MKTLMIYCVMAVLAAGMTAAGQTRRVSLADGGNECRMVREVFEYDFVDSKPSFPGGREALMEFVNKTRRYPADAYQRGIEGRVTCSFIIDEDGRVTNVQVIKAADRSLNEEALRILCEMPDWQPGRHSGVAVPVRVVHCIPFRR